MNRSSVLVGLMVTGLFVFGAVPASGATITSIVGTESLVTDSTGTDAINIAAANGASLTSLISIDGGGGDGPNGTSSTGDPYDASRYIPTNTGGSAGSLTSNGVTVDYGTSGNGTVDFTFTYAAIVDVITSATFFMDVSDDDNNFLTFTTDDGQNIGSTGTLGNGGKPSTFWTAIDDQANFNIDASLAITLTANELVDLADGSYKLSGAWGGTTSFAGLYATNRAKLVIDFVPEPSSILLLIVGLGLVISGKVVRRPRNR